MLPLEQAARLFDEFEKVLEKVFDKLGSKPNRRL
jgi:hypothetical protein